MRNPYFVFRKETTMNRNSLRNTQYATIIALAFAIAFAFGVLAQGSAPTDDEVNRIAKQLYCPVCENTPLDVCPTEACRQWREDIRTLLAEGKSEDEIIQYFADYHGARVLNEPPNRLVTYLVPVTAILLGALLLLRGFQMWIKPQKTEAVAAESEARPIPQDDYVARFEEELRKRK
jgi:cytochrome c-type biogenesis protein CcmH